MLLSSNEIEDHSRDRGLEVFISYSRCDQAWAKQLSALLDAHDRLAWIDWQDIPPNADWRQEIRTGILSANSCL
ncbi:MAG: hypothetical protein C4287_15775 [Leptolyngbya sp. ERB_1_2]